MSLKSTLRQVPLFAQLRESDLDLLAPLFVEREYPRNRVIRFAHDPCDALYVVLRGQLKVMLVSEDGREVVLGLVREGDFFGTNVAMAARVAAQAAGGEILVSDDVRQALRDVDDIVLVDFREAELKGLPGTYRLWEVAVV